MTNITKKFVAGFAAVALLASSFSGVALAGTTIEITGNGAGSDNVVNVEQKSEVKVEQNNDADIDNNIDSSASTGGNSTNYNTGGDVMINTGNASVDTTVANVVNSNYAEVDCCASGDTEVKISENGAYTNNWVGLEQKTETKIDQENDADIDNDVDSSAKTGYNDAHKNTGGDVIINTGKASASTTVTTQANVNSARVKSSGGNPSASFLILSNGAGSDNGIEAELETETELDQDNDADVDNNVDSYAKSGENDASWNTGGDVMIDTGKASVDATVDNAVNFNYADVDCGCTWDVLAKIAGNGAAGYHDSNEADNFIGLELESEQEIDQENEADLDNDLDAYAKTGYNEAELNNGAAESDPSINTGDAEVYSNVSNTGNVNSVGDMMDWDMPEMPDFEYSFNFAAMMAFFGLSF